MKNIYQRLVIIVLITIISIRNPMPIFAQEDNLVEAPNAVLMEATTGTVIYEKNGDERKSPASITKIMTLLLIYDARKEEKIHQEDIVTTSAYAKSMGGSQVFLEEGETQTVETLIKCIVIASGNDASVAMAEYISGSEESFVKEMNARAKSLNMKNTHFVDCCGLTESPDQFSSAMDVAIMSRELVINYPDILTYSSIWMENITHNTRQGSSEFCLTNTNKLLRSFDGCVGLKTGSTSIAKYCLSAVAKRDQKQLISVVLASPESKKRFRDAAALLNYGFAKCNVYVDENPLELSDLSVKKGVKDRIPLLYEKKFEYVTTDGTAIKDVKRKILLPEFVEAPVKKGKKVGQVVYFVDQKEIGRVNIISGKTIKKAKYKDYLERLWKECLL